MILSETPSITNNTNEENYKSTINKGKKGKSYTHANTYK